MLVIIRTFVTALRVDAMQVLILTLVYSYCLILLKGFI